MNGSRGKRGAVRAGMALGAMLMLASTAEAANPDGSLRIELISGYNFVVDSNVETPATYAPRSAYLGATFHNDGTTPLTNVYAYIGNYDGGTNATPGIYPSRTHVGLTGTFALQQEGGSQGSADATRYLGTIEPGESKTVYWLVSYPNLDDNGNSVAGGVKPDDDLWLYFDVWGEAYEGANLRTADVRRQVFMRRMLSAMANKISPNGANKVPQEYQDLLQMYEPSWTNNLVDGSPGSGITTEGIWYDLGNINQGFDNDGDLIPDYNAWMQPVGDPSIFDAGCFRLVKTFAMVVIKRSAGDVVILAEDQLYFSNLPDDNNGAVGYVRYEFMPLCSGASATLSPYQAVASGKDNEKFNGDFGATLGGGLTSTAPSVELDKDVDLAIAGAGSNLAYTVTFTNPGTVAIGRPDVGLPLVISDSIPMGSTYEAGSAAAGNTLPLGVTEYTIFFSTNSGVSWTQSEPVAPGDVTDIRWGLSDPLEPGAVGAVTFEVVVDDPAPPLIYNVAGLGLGSAVPFLEADAITLVTGNYLISGTVFEDTGVGAGGESGNGIQDGGEPGISNVVISLYYDTNGDGILDAGDVLYATIETDVDGNYTFTDLPDGNYIVVVDALDPDLPTGYNPTSLTAISVEIGGGNETGNDFGFMPGLGLTKTGPSMLEKGGEAVYTIAITNLSSASGQGPTLVYTNWSQARDTAKDQGTDWLNHSNAVGDPDTLVASLKVGNNVDRLGLGGFGPDRGGSVTNVKLVVRAYRGAASDTRDRFRIILWTNAAPAGVQIVEYQTPVLPTASTDLIFDVTTNFTSLSWASLTNASIQIEGRKVGGAGATTISVDAAGLIFSFEGPVGVLETVPLYDYYDTNVLQFVSAAPPITSSDNDWPAPNTGRLYWGNVGPLAPEEGTNVIVTFNVIGPPGNAGIITTNRAEVTNAVYNTGVLANEAFDEAVSEVPATASIGDTIFWDANRSGSQDDNEGGIEGVTVELYTNGTLVASIVTDSNGNYLFSGLAPGTYTVLVVTNGGLGYPLNDASLSAHPDNDGVPIGHPDATVSNNYTTVTLMGGQTFMGADFGYVPPGGTIGGLLWVDFNDDGMPNGGESGIPFITVTLYSNGVAVATTETDADGYYLFYGLPDGMYRVEVHTNDVDFPSGLAQTVDPDALLDSVATKIVISGGSIVTIDDAPWTAGDLEVNFGYRYEGNSVLSGTVGMDDPDNIDGLLNGLNPSGVGANETAFTGVTVYVYLWNDDGNGVVNSGETILLGTTVTDANGNYSFANLPDGGPNDYYIVSLVAPANYLALTTTTNDTPAVVLYNNMDLTGNTLSAYQAVPVAPSTENIDFAFISTVAYDFGDLPDSYRTTLANNGPRHIIGSATNLFLGAWVSTEPNGQPSIAAAADVYDDGVFVDGIWQNGASGATVRVRVGAGSGWLVGFVDFDHSGEFDNANELVFSEVVAFNGGPSSDGWYDLTLDVPADTLSTTNSTYLYSRWRLLPSEPFLPALAFQGEASNGEVEDYRWGFHVIGGSVFVDDGLVKNDFDVDDSPQHGVAINLFENGTLVATTVTGLDGFYSFYGVPDGDYLVTMEEPIGATAILDADGGGNTFTNIAVTVAGADVFDRDFLLNLTPTRVTLAAFDAIVRDGAVVVRWETAVEQGAMGFYLERRMADGWTPVGGFVPAMGEGRYEQVDGTAPLNGTLTYFLTEIDNTGRVNTYGPFRVWLNGAQSLSQWLEAAGLGADADPEADADGDGMSNRDEFLAGTDANDAASALRIVEIRAEAQGVTLRWNSEAGRVYTIERAEAPGGTAEIAADDVPATPPVNELLLPPEHGARVYRVKLK